MAGILVGPRIKQNCTVASGVATLTTAVTGYRTLTNAATDPNLALDYDGSMAVEYMISNAGGTVWEVGLGTYSHTAGTVTLGPKISSADTTSFSVAVIADGTYTIEVVPLGTASREMQNAVSVEGDNGDSATGINIKAYPAGAYWEIRALNRYYNDFRTIGPGGIVQHDLYSKQQTIHVSAGGTSFSSMGCVMTVVGTATARTSAVIASGGATGFTRMALRTGVVSAATAGSLASIRGGDQRYSSGVRNDVNDVMHPTGYVARFRFNVSDAAAVSGARMFVGMRASVAAPTNVAPDSTTNTIGLAQLNTSATEWYIVCNGSTTGAGIATGIPIHNGTVGINTGNTIELCIVDYGQTSTGNTADIYITVRDLSNGNAFRWNSTAAGVASTRTPVDQLLNPMMWRTNNTTALAVGFDVQAISVEAFGPTQGG